jgi:hypothetical protein
MSSSHQLSLGSDFAFQLADRGVGVTVVTDRKTPAGFTTAPTGVQYIVVIDEDPALAGTDTYMFTAIANCVQIGDGSNVPVPSP